MVNFSSSDQTPLVIDTSVAINLEASGIAVRVLEIFARPVFIVDIVPGELAGGRGHGPKVRAAIDDWTQRGLTSIVQLSASANAIFEELVVGAAAETLDDGEAATLAHAIDVGAIAVIDETKARRISAQRFSALPVASSTDLLLAPFALESLGTPIVSDAVHNALVKARMRVPPERIVEVIRLIGPDRAADCHALPASARIRRIA